MTPATLSLTFQVDNEKTQMRVAKQDPPWRAIRAFPNQSGESLVHLNNVSGGVLGGDRLHLEVRVGERALAQITSVGSTRLYRRKGNGETSQMTNCLRVARGAYLEYLPDSVIPFRDSAFHQSSTFHLAEGAGLIAWEILAAGRVAYGERFAFESFASRTAIHGPGGLLALENFCLRPSVQNLRSPARFGRFHYSATMWVCRIDDNSLQWMEWEQRLNEEARRISDSSVSWGASTLHQHGLFVRGLAAESHQITSGLRTLWQMAKQLIWNRPALPPRKVN